MWPCVPMSRIHLTCQQLTATAMPQAYGYLYISKNSQVKTKLKVILQKTVTHVVPTVKGMTWKSLQTMTTCYIKIPPWTNGHNLDTPMYHVVSYHHNPNQHRIHNECYVLYTTKMFCQDGVQRHHTVLRKVGTEVAGALNRGAWLDKAVVGSLSAIHCYSQPVSCQPLQVYNKIPGDIAF